MTYRKAIVAAVVAFLTPVVTYLYGVANGGAYDWRHLLGAVLGGLVAAAAGGGITYAVPNRPQAPVHVVAGRHEAVDAPAPTEGASMREAN